MANRRVARRYARAAFDIAVSSNAIDVWIGDLQRIRQFVDSPVAMPTLANPRTAFELKRQFIDGELRGVGDLARNLLYVVVRNGRVSEFGDIQEHFHELVNENRGIAEATVTTAIPLRESETLAVTARLSALIGKSVIVRTDVNPSILGGIVVRIGDRIVDGSVANQLAQLRAELSR